MSTPRLFSRSITEYQGFSYRAYEPKMARYLSRDPIGMLGGMSVYSYVSNRPIMRADPMGLFGMDMPGAAHRASQGTWMMQSGETPEAISNAMAPPPPVPVGTSKCKAQTTAAAGISLSGSLTINSRTGLGAIGSFQTSTIAGRASASCGLKIAAPNAKPLRVALGVAVSLWIINIEATQTPTYPDIHIEIGPGYGVEFKAPINPSLNISY